MLFPLENDDLSERKFEYKSSERTPAFIILDGIWKEEINSNLAILKNKLKYILKHYMMNSGIDVLY